jgi:hypothetical protein
VVTNYDTMVWENGSFYSAAGATNAPTANAFTGIAYATDANNIVVEARDMTTGIKHVRKKSAGTWGSWSADSGSGAFVLKAGDTYDRHSHGPGFISNQDFASNTANVVLGANGWWRVFKAQWSG